MKKEKSIKDWERMYKEMTDPEYREKIKNKLDTEKRLKEERSDTGLEE